MLSDKTKLHLAEIQKPMEDWRVLAGCCALSVVIGVPVLYALVGGAVSVATLAGGLLGLYLSRDDLKKGAKASRKRRLELEDRVSGASKGARAHDEKSATRLDRRDRG